MDDNTIIDAVHEAKLLGLFKALCDSYNNNSAKQSLRNIYYKSNNGYTTTQNLIKREFDESLNNSECRRMTDLITAFLNKKEFRKHIDESTRLHLLSNQGSKCAFCHCVIDYNAPVDHIVPFKYVGDELGDNYQMLCTHCNSKKKDSIDYQIKVLLKLV